MKDYLEDLYNDTFNTMYADLLARKQNDSGFTKLQLQNFCKACT